MKTTRAAQAPFVTAVVVALAAMFAPAASAWKLLADKDHTRVEKQNDEAGRTELRITGDIARPCAQAEAVLRDLDSFNKWMPGVYGWKRVQDQRGRDVFYGHIPLPFPFADRDYVVRYDKRKTTKGWTVTAQSIKNVGPEPEGTVHRMTDVFSQWSTEPNAEGGCHVTYWERSSIGGAVPDFLVEKSFVDSASGMLVALNARAAALHDALPGDKKKTAP